MSTLIVPTIHIVAFCGAHIDEEDQIETLEKMLISWKIQSTSCPLYLSLSFEADELKEQALEVLNQFDTQLTIYLHKTTKFLFQHYLYLASRFDNKSSELIDWVVFSEIDCEWNPKRIQEYQSAISHYHQLTAKKSAQIILPHVVICQEKLQRVRGQYLDYAVQFSALQFFLNQTDPIVWTHSLAGAFLVKYLMYPNTNQTLQGLRMVSEATLLRWAQPKKSGDLFLPLPKDDQYNYLLYVSNQSGPFNAEQATVTLKTISSQITPQRLQDQIQHWSQFAQDQKLEAFRTTPSIWNYLLQTTTSELKSHDIKCE